MHCEFAESFVPERVLAIGAHADDIDFMAAGTIGAWAKQGAHIEYIVATDGGKGSRVRSVTSADLVTTRQREQREAARLLGVKSVHFLGYEDGGLEVSIRLKKDLVRLIRHARPDTVITMDPTVIYSSGLGLINHSDHRAIGQATLDAIFPLSRDHLSFPELLQHGFEPHVVLHVLLTNFEKQNCFIDISPTFELKLEALSKHISQFPDIEAVHDTVRSMARQSGAAGDFLLAEGFVRIDVQP